MVIISDFQPEKLGSIPSTHKHIKNRIISAKQGCSINRYNIRVNRDDTKRKEWSDITVPVRFWILKFNKMCIMRTR